MQLIARHFCVTLNFVATATCIALAPVASAQAPGSGGDAAKAGGVVVEEVPQNDPENRSGMRQRLLRWRSRSM